jgi:hypothetical protein
MTSLIPFKIHLLIIIHCPKAKLVDSLPTVVHQSAEFFEPILAGTSRRRALVSRVNHFYNSYAVPSTLTLKMATKVLKNIPLVD